VVSSLEGAFQSPRVKSWNYARIYFAKSNPQNFVWNPILNNAYSSADLQLLGKMHALESNFDTSLGRIFQII